MLSLVQEFVLYRVAPSVARIEKRGYDAYTLTTLRRYVQALSDGFQLEVTIRRTMFQQLPQATAGS